MVVFIFAEVVRRKLLEANPVSSNNDEPVVFDTSIVPWWAWVKRFHLPEAELLNGESRCFSTFWLSSLVIVWRYCTAKDGMELTGNC